MRQEEIIYKVCDRSLWETSVADGVFRGAEIDLADGFIHFSAANQVVETVAKHFAGRENLLLIAIEAKSLGDSLRWEKSRNGDLFPHLYAPLETANAVRVDDLGLDENGKHCFPKDLDLGSSKE